VTRREWVKTITAAGAMLLCWGTAPVAINFLNNTYSLVFQAFTRYALSMVLLWLYQKVLLCREDWEDLWHLVPRHLPWIVLAGFLTFVFQLFFTATYFYLAPGFANLLYQNQVVFSLFMGMLFFTEERAVLKNRFFYLGLGAVVTGVILVIRSRFGGISGSLDPGCFSPWGRGWPGLLWG
jgi:drug/metabolite transporter (DMT)-like permease